MIWIILVLFIIALTVTVLMEKRSSRKFDINDMATWGTPESLMVVGVITIMIFITLCATGICLIGVAVDYNIINEQIEFLSNNSYTVNITGDINVSTDVNAMKLMDLQTELISLEKTLKILLFM